MSGSIPLESAGAVAVIVYVRLLREIGDSGRHGCAGTNHIALPGLSAGVASQFKNIGYSPRQDGSKIRSGVLRYQCRGGKTTAGRMPCWRRGQTVLFFSAGNGCRYFLLAQVTEYRGDMDRAARA